MTGGRPDPIEGADAVEVPLDEVVRSLAFATDAVVVADATGRIAAAGALCTALLGYAPEELVGQQVEMLLPSRYRSSHEQLRVEYARHPSPRRMGTGLDLFARHRDGREIAVDVTLNPVRTNRGSMVIAGVRDQTERYRSRLAIERLAREHALLGTLSTAVAEHASLSGVFDLAVGEMGRLFEARLSALMRTVDEPVGTAELLSMSHRGVMVAPRPEDWSVTLATSCVESRAVRTRRLAIGDSALAPGDGDAVAVPVVVSGMPWGALIVAGVRGDRDSLGEHLSAVAHLVAVAVSQAEMRAELIRRAESDALTHLPNRAVFDERLPREVVMAAETGAPLSVAVVDADRFKKINDDHGHPVGDAVLVEIADRMRGVLREGDLLCRLGGEEFAAVLPDTDANSALDIGERLRHAVARAPIPAVGAITVSVGVATWEDGMSRLDLVRCADRAMYEAKQAGRNATRAAVPDSPMNVIRSGV